MTGQISVSTVVGVLATAVSAGIGLVFMWWGVRKATRMLFKAFRDSRTVYIIPYSSLGTACAILFLMEVLWQAILISGCRGSLDPENFFRTMQYKIGFRKEHPEYFDPDGIIVFCGGQGAGKTLSLVQYVQRLCDRYPAVKVCSNMSIDLPENIRGLSLGGCKELY